MAFIAITTTVAGPVSEQSGTRKAKMRIFEVSFKLGGVVFFLFFCFV